MTQRRMNRIKKDLRESAALHHRIVTNALIEKGQSVMSAKLGADLIVAAARSNDDSIQRSANTYRAILGIEPRFGA
jgi:hypothetical protein